TLRSMAVPPDPLGMTPSALERWAEEAGLPRYRGRQIFDRVHRRLARGYAEGRELPADLRDRLGQEMPLRFPEVAQRERAADGSVKLGLRLSDGALIEAVYMPGGAQFSLANEFTDARAQSRETEVGKRETSSTPPADKFTVCLSSQTGCAVDCAFCVTGRLGGGRNLSAGE